jgi:tetratricopeptide (TPR) repeat protein
MKAKKMPVASKGRLLAFKLIALALPFLIILLLEGVLRLSGYGHDLSVFVADSEHTDCLVVNKYVSERYFTNGANATIGNFEPFKKVKPKGTTRIFVLGESTTIGYPYMHNGSFHRWLNYRLLQMYPEKEFEVINLSLTAVNSYTVLDMAAELYKYSPDAVLIYSGHNEYYGALGVGSTSKLGNSDWLIHALIRLKQFRVVQLLFNSTGRSKGDGIDTNKSLMERMAADQHIAYGSVKFNKGIGQFKRNINQACSVLSAHQIPVFISNLVSNEKDLKPFINDGAAGPLSADVQFSLGRLAYKGGDSISARRFFKNASERDLLRFRAPELINTAIREATQKYKGVFLVDTRSIFKANSKYGIIGNETLLEHVHPNLSGYSLISEAFFQSLKLHHILPASNSADMTLDQLRAQMPVTIVDSLFGAYSVQKLKEAWPFERVKHAQEGQVSAEGKIAMDLLTRHLRWNDAMDQLMTLDQQHGDKYGQLKVAEAVMLEYPHDATFYAVAGQMAIRVNETAKAANYLSRAFAITPSLQLASALFALEIKMERPEKAIRYIDYALAVHPGDQGLLMIRSRLTKLIALQVMLRRQPGNMDVRGQIGKAYTDLRSFQNNGGTQN